MSFSFGSLGLISLRMPFAELVVMVLGKTDLRSMFCLVVCFIVVFVLAYLTNPSENSFRAYLTEQSFRQHLSRLDDNVDDNNHSTSNLTASTNLPKRSTPATTHPLSFDNSSPFHFANRASISLRTPKHVFHSFGIFTVAAMVPLARPARRDERDGPMISDSWYIGAFGRWWRVGIIEAWYQDVITRSKDEESWSSGILSMKNLDILNEYSGLPFSTKGLPPHILARGSPPKLRNRERSSQRPAILPTRSLSPPPLPKSASLPLHTARTPSLSTVDRPSAQPLVQSHSQSCLTPEQGRLSASLSRSPSSLFDQSPRIAEVLRQISLSKTLVLDLRSQLTDCQQSASHSHSLLQGEVDSFRGRKRKEDAIKFELKSRTKALDDSKRVAEGTKKDAEKKLKAAQNARDNATQRMDHLDKEISQLQQRLLEDGALIHRPKDTLSDAEREIVDALEHKKLEIKVAEDIVTALNQRARDLEDKLSEEKEKLARLKERNEIRRQERTLRFSQNETQVVSSAPWSSVVHHSQDFVDSSSAPETPERKQGLTGFEVISGLGRRPSITRDAHTSSRPNALTLGTLSNFSSHTGTAYPTINTTQAALRANGYSVFDDSMVSVSRHNASNFSPFGDNEVSQPRNISSVGSPTSQSLLPSNLITPVGNADGVSRSFQSDSDVYMDKDWRGFNAASYMQQNAHRSNNFTSVFGAVTTSPVSLHGPSIHDYELDPFEVRFMSGDYGHEHQTRHHMTVEDSMDSQRASWLHRTNSDPNPNQYAIDYNQTNSMVTEKASPRRWFSTTSKERPKRGLNPDAKVFNLARKSSPRKFAPGPVLNENAHSIKTAAYDALNPNGLGPASMPAPASTNNSLLRAFAPSPAEREVLQRALGGSTNTSFERLPSLSDVGSIPSSPSHIHALPADHVPQNPVPELGKTLPSWLQSLPRIRKPNFSPWDDEEPSSPSVVGNTGGSVRRR